MIGLSFSLRLIRVRVFFTITEMKLGQKRTADTAISCRTLEEESAVIHSAITAKDRRLTAVRGHSLSEARQDSQ